MMKSPNEKIIPLTEEKAIELANSVNIPSFAKYKGVAATMIEHGLFKKSDKSTQWQIDDLCMKLEYCRSMGYSDCYANNVYIADGKFEEDFKILSYIVAHNAPDAEFYPIISTNEKCVIKWRRTIDGSKTDWTYVTYDIEDAKREGHLNKNGKQWVGNGLQNMINKNCYARAMRQAARVESRGGHITSELPNVPINLLSEGSVEEDAGIEESDNIESEIKELKAFVPIVNNVVEEPKIVEKPIEPTPKVEEKIELIDFDFGEPQKPEPIIVEKIEKKPEPVVEFTANEVIIKNIVEEEIKKEEYDEYCLTDTCQICNEVKNNICGATGCCAECDTKKAQIINEKPIEEIEKKTRKKKTTSKKEVITAEIEKPFPIKELALLEPDIDAKEVYEKISNDWFASISIDDIKDGNIDDFNVIAYIDAILTVFPKETGLLNEITNRVKTWCANTSNVAEKIIVFWHDSTIESGLEIKQIDNCYIRTMLKTIKSIEKIATIVKVMKFENEEEKIAFIANASDKEFDIKKARWAIRYMYARNLI